MQEWETSILELSKYCEETREYELEHELLQQLLAGIRL